MPYPMLLQPPLAQLLKQLLLQLLLPRPPLQLSLRLHIPTVAHILPLTLHNPANEQSRTFDKQASDSCNLGLRRLVALPKRAAISSTELAAH